MAKLQGLQPKFFSPRPKIIKLMTTKQTDANAGADEPAVLSVGLFLAGPVSTYKAASRVYRDSHHSIGSLGPGQSIGGEEDRTCDP